MPGRNACEIKMFHQEDAGLNVEMAKLAFSRGIWSYVCKMDTALRRYSTISNHQLSSGATAVTLIKKVRTILFNIVILFNCLYTLLVMLHFLIAIDIIYQGTWLVCHVLISVES